MDQRSETSVGAKMLNVQIIQPLVPEYRVPFFDMLALDGRCHVQVFASDTSPGGQNLRSAKTLSDFIHLDYPSKQFLRQKILWQKGLQLEDRLQPGDVLVLCGNPRFFSNYPLIWKAKRRNIATVWWGIGTMPSQNPLTGFVRRLIMRWMDIVLLYTERERAEFQQMGFPADRLFAMNNAIDQRPIQEAIKHWSPDRLKDFQRDNDLSGRQVFLFCGRLTPKARLDLALRALAEMLAETPNTLLVVIGDGEERTRLQGLAKELGIPDSVRWMGTIYDQHTMAPWFLSAKAFVYPGYIGLSILHSMGYGLPVITHHNMSNQSPEIAALRDGQNGLLFQEGDIGDLVRTMHRLTSCEADRLVMGKQASRTAAQEFTLEEMVRRFIVAIEAARDKVRPAKI